MLKCLRMYQKLLVNARVWKICEYTKSNTSCSATNMIMMEHLNHANIEYHRPVHTCVAKWSPGTNRKHRGDRSYHDVPPTVLSNSMFSCAGQNVNSCRSTFSSQSECHYSTDGGGKVNTENEMQKWKGNIDLDQLTGEQLKIHKQHLLAIEHGQPVYIDPATGYEVTTTKEHLTRGYCCGNVCRHCPYKHINAPPQFRDMLRHNSAFYY